MEDRGSFVLTDAPYSARAGHWRAAQRDALKLRALGLGAHPMSARFPLLRGRTTGILPYLRAPASFERLLGRDHSRADFGDRRPTTHLPGEHIGNLCVPRNRFGCTCLGIAPKRMRSIFT